MDWLIPPNSKHDGYCVGDVVSLRNELATVVPAEGAYKNRFGHELYPNTFVPVIRESGNVDGWDVNETKIVQRARKVFVRGNELCMEES